MSIKSQTQGGSDLPLMSKQRAPSYIMGKKEKSMPLNEEKENVKSYKKMKTSKDHNKILSNENHEKDKNKSSYRHIEHR